MNGGFRSSERERGAALLGVLVFVAIVGGLSAIALEKLRLSTSAATNAAATDRARGYASGIEELVLLGLEERLAASPQRMTLAGGWNGATRRFPLPVGNGVAHATLRDGGNCFNLNSVVQGDGATTTSARPAGIAQFRSLLQLLAVPEGEAAAVAAAAADWADGDTLRGPLGAEDGDYARGDRPYRSANTIFADVSELRAVRGVTPQLYERVRPWVCALPSTELSSINANTLLPEQAPLLAMLAPDRLDIARARRVIESRPINGWGNQIAFWQQEALRDVTVPLEVQLQPQLVTRWFVIDSRVRILDSEFSEEVLVDARLQPLRIVSRRWGE